MEQKENRQEPEVPLEPEPEKPQLSARQKKNRRTSILKEVPDAIGFCDNTGMDITENTAAIARRKSRRVSFAETKMVKTFKDSATDGTEWNASYVATVSSSSSSDSSAAVTTLDAGHDSTHGERSHYHCTEQQQYSLHQQQTVSSEVQLQTFVYLDEKNDGGNEEKEDSPHKSSSDFIAFLLSQNPVNSSQSDKSYSSKNTAADQTCDSADMELTGVVPGPPINSSTPAVTMVGHEDVNHEKHSIKQGPECGGRNEDTRGLADMELTSAASHIYQTIPATQAVDTDGTRGLIDMELTCAASNIHKMKPGEQTDNSDETRGLTDMELTCAASNIYKMKPGKQTDNSDETRGLTDMELTCAASNIYKMKPGKQTDNFDETCGLTDMELTSAASNIHNMQRGVKSIVTDDTQGRAEMELICASTNIHNMNPNSVHTNAVATEQVVSSSVRESTPIENVNRTVNCTASVVSTSVCVSKKITFSDFKHSDGEKSISSDKLTVQLGTFVKEVISTSSYADSVLDNNKECNTSRVTGHAQTSGNTTSSVVNMPSAQTNITDQNCSLDNPTSSSKQERPPFEESSGGYVTPINNTDERHVTEVSADVPTTSVPVTAVQDTTAAAGQTIVTAGKKRPSLDNASNTGKKVIVLSKDGIGAGEAVYFEQDNPELFESPSLSGVTETANLTAIDCRDDSLVIPVQNIKEELDNSNDSREFLSNVTVQLVDSDDSFVSPEKSLCEKEDEIPDIAKSRRQSFITAALSATNEYPPGGQDSGPQIDDLIKELNKSLSKLTAPRAESDTETSMNEGSEVKLEESSSSPDGGDLQESFSAVTVANSIFIKAEERRKSMNRLSIDKMTSVSVDLTNQEEVQSSSNEEAMDSADASQQVNSNVINSSQEPQTARIQTEQTRCSDVMEYETLEDHAQDGNDIASMLPNTSSIPVVMIQQESVQNAEGRKTTSEIASTATSSPSGDTAVVQHQEASSGESTPPARVDNAVNICKASINEVTAQTAVPLPARISTMSALCNVCSSEEEKILYKESSDTLLMQRCGNEVALRFFHRKLRLLLTVAGPGRDGRGHAVVKSAQWGPTVEELKKPMARLVAATFADSMSQCCDALLGLRLCCLPTMVPSLLLSYNAMTDLLFGLHETEFMCAVSYQNKDKVLLRLLGRGCNLLEVTCSFLCDVTGPNPCYSMSLSVRTVLGCIRASSVEAAMRSVSPGPRLLPRAVDAALGIMKNWLG